MGRLEESSGHYWRCGRHYIAAAKRLPKGAKILLVDLNEQALQVAAAEVGNNVCHYCAADVTQRDDNERMAQQVVDIFGGVDIFLANAGIEGEIKPFLEFSDEMFDKVMAVNVRGVWLGVQVMFPLMQKRGGGSIIITSSVAGVRGSEMLAPYVTSKHAVVGLMRSAALPAHTPDTSEFCSSLAHRDSNDEEPGGGNHARPG